MSKDIEIIIDEINNLRCELNMISLVLLEKEKKDYKYMIELSKRMDKLLNKYSILIKYDNELRKEEDV